MNFRVWHLNTGFCFTFCVLTLAAGCNKAQTPTGPSISPALACQGYGPQASSPYVLPYLPGQAYPVIQGNCSNGPTHIAGSVQKYAYDFGMSIGTAVYAARAGIVIGVDQRNADFNGANAAANYVWVRHSDNTVGRYWHLTQNGARVIAGQTVQVGDLLAMSGATGLSSDPQLHFDEAECGPATCQTLPINFRNTVANANGLEAGKTYVAQ